ncbi:MAG: T9SS type A sorting domain-containing protein [Calditrichaceae bacterium]|nr:T9SS type A sorting domain-containing protein [Calditrichaceae bacterium]MBN2709783.1 T9SS type A sorting domain-containing protein [Calditrichaceae bacterium]RQV94977.1 MAG: T9SS C-terminal target domain-containing protein [Calditrichota bacterium]
MKVILIFLLFIFSALYADHIQDDIERYKDKGNIKIEYIEDYSIKIINTKTGNTKYVNIKNTKNIDLNKNVSTQIFDLPNIPVSLYEHRYIYKSRILIGQSYGYPMVFGDFNNNGKLDIAGLFKLVQDYEIGQAGIFELQEDSSFTQQYLYAYSDSSLQPLSITDLDKDGLLELNIKRGQTFRNYEQAYPDTFPTDSVFDHRMWQVSGMVGSETFCYIDYDSLMDVAYVGDDTLAPSGNKLYIAEYKPELNNFVQVGRFPFPEWRVSGISIGDFDGDNHKEVVTGSIHGDIYVVENTGDDSYTQTFTSTISTSNAYLNCTTNDIDHNGKIEFFIGASSYWSDESATRVCWFEADGDNNYVIEREVFLKGTGVLGTTEMYNYDVNADGVDDLVFAFEHYVVILVWNNSRQQFELFYLNHIDLGYSMIESVIVYNVYNDKNPNLFITVEDAWHYPRLSTFYYKPDLTTGFQGESNKLISEYRLEQNYPNPFNNASVIPFYLPKSCIVYLTIYDLTGKEVKKLINNQKLFQGKHQVTWNGQNNKGKEVSSGFYIFQLKTDDVTLVKKLLLIK